MPPQQESLRGTGPSPHMKDEDNTGNDDHALNATPLQLQRRSSSRVHFSQMQELDVTPRIQQSFVRRESFIVQFAKTKGPPQITFIMMLIAIGLGSTIGVVPAVMSDRFARLQHGYSSDALCSSYTTLADKPSACLAGSADAQAAVASANLISNVLTFVTSSLIGSLSDEHGRKGTHLLFKETVSKQARSNNNKPSNTLTNIVSCHANYPLISPTAILIVGLLMGMLSPLMLFLIQIIPTMSPWWYYGCHAATGLVNWVAIALSALADVLPQRFRAPGIGLLLAGFMLGFSLSPILTFLLSNTHLSLLSFIVVGLGLFATIFFVPETLPPNVAEETKARRQMERLREQALDEQSSHEEERDQCARKWRRTMRIVGRFLVRPFKEMAILNRDSFFRLISLLAFFSGMVASGDQVLLVYYLEERLSFTAQDISVMFLIMGIMGLLAQGVLLKPLNDCLGEKLVVAFCFFVGAVDNTMYGIAKNKATIYAAVALSALTGMAFPTISAIKANNVAVTEQGRIQGALYSLQALASGVGPVLLRFVYSQAKESVLGPGAMFVFAGLLYLVAVGVACALPSERANARIPDDAVDDEDDTMFFHQLISSNSEESAGDSYGSIA